MTQPAGVETQKAKERRQVIPLFVERPDLHYPYSHLSKDAGEEVAQTEMRAQPLTRDAREARNSIHIPSRDGTSAVAISPYRGATEQMAAPLRRSKYCRTISAISNWIRSPTPRFVAPARMKRWSG